MATSSLTIRSQVTIGAAIASLGVLGVGVFGHAAATGSATELFSMSVVHLALVEPITDSSTPRLTDGGSGGGGGWFGGGNGGNGGNDQSTGQHSNDGNGAGNGSGNDNGNGSANGNGTGNGSANRK